MSTYREVIYMVMDRLKLISDDAYFNEEHVKFLLDKYRALIVKRLVEAEEEAGEEVSEENLTTICLDLENALSVAGMPCEGIYLKSKQKVPSISNTSTARIYSGDFLYSEITLVSWQRLKYVGRNRWLKNIIYAAIGPDNYLYLTSSNPQYLYLTKVTISAVFDDVDEAAALACCSCDSDACDPYDSSFPLESAYIPQIITYVVKDLGTSMGIPEDVLNDAADMQSSAAARAVANTSAEGTKKSTNQSTDDDDDEDEDDAGS